MNVRLKDGMVCQVREKQPQDGEALGKMLEGCSEETYHFFHPYPLTAESGKKVAADGKIVCHILWVGKEAAGYVWLEKLNEKIPALGICVGDAWQGRGIGRILMNTSVDYVRRLGKAGVRLTVNQDNWRGQELYASVGFEFVGETKGRFPSYAMRLGF